MDIFTGEYSKMTWDQAVMSKGEVFIGEKKGLLMRFFGPYRIVDAAQRLVKNPWECVFQVTGENLYKQRKVAVA